MNEELIISLAPKTMGANVPSEELNKRIEEKRTEIKQNSFLDPLDAEAFFELNAPPHLGLSAASRMGKG